MNRKSLTLLTAAALVVALSAAFLMTSSPADAGETCGPCGGPVITVHGHASGGSCSENLANAYADALSKAWSGGFNLQPCQITEGPGACYVTGNGGSGASQTLYHRTRSCSFGGL